MLRKGYFMNLTQRIYSVLVVSSAEKLNIPLSSLLAEPRYHPVRFVSSVKEAKNACNELRYDHIIINSPLPDDPAIRFAADAASGGGTAVLLLIRPELYEDTFEKVTKHGVFVLPKPLSKSTLTVALKFMESAREHMRKLEQKTLSAQEKVEEIRIVNRAKWLLISELKMDEPQAHRYIEKQAMDRCISKREVAEEIIKTYA